eukprot:6201883-Pleurochrysis_carterae.AAC.1
MAIVLRTTKFTSKQAFYAKIKVIHSARIVKGAARLANGTLNDFEEVFVLKYQHPDYVSETY